MIVILIQFRFTFKFPISKNINNIFTSNAIFSF